MNSEPDATQLLALLAAARERTLMLAEGMPGERELGPQLAIVNPPLWEFGHVGWFQEHWCLRYTQGSGLRPSSIANADALYDSAKVPHATRWSLPLPDFGATLDYLRDTFARVAQRLEREGATDHLRYFLQLAAFHEEMHCEAFTYTRQTLGYPAPRLPGRVDVPACAPVTGDVSIPGGRFVLGAVPGSGFVFDNEKWAHEVIVGPFRMARAAVTNDAFAAFVDDGGYRKRACWSEAGWHWRESVGAECPVYWTRDDGTWMVRQYDHTVPLDPHAAVVHVNWFEAEAWCRWAGRRLPTEAEWEFAASTAPDAIERKRRYPWGDDAPDPARANLYGVGAAPAAAAAFNAGDCAWGLRQLFGNVWEWTADRFDGYPGFVRDPYKEYSEPWFGNHMVLRGGCFATRATLLRNTWRNFYTPDRRDVFAGFRTCAP